MKHFKKYWGVYAGIAAFLIIVAINWKSIVASFQGKFGRTAARQRMGCVKSGAAAPNDCIYRGQVVSCDACEERGLL